MKITKHLSCLTALLLAVLLLSACGSGDSVDPPATDPAGVEDSGGTSGAASDTSAPEESTPPEEAEPEESTPEEPAAAEPSPEELALEQYRLIIGQADTYDYGSFEAPSGYQYALVWMQTGDAVPTLLLKQQAGEAMDYVRVFQYEPESGTVLQPEDILMEGVASAGGFRGSLAMQADGAGIYSFEMSSGTGNTSITRVTLADGALQYGVQWQGMFDEIPEEPGSVEIVWYGIGNTSALDNWPEPGSPAEPEEPGEPAEDSNEALPAEEGRIVFTGTIDVYTYDQVIEMQGAPDPNGGYESGNTYRLIVLDTPQTMSLSSTGDPDNDYYEDTVDMIYVAGNEDLDQYNGQHLTFSIDPDNTWWPSDTSLPLGRPSTSDVHVLQ